MRSKAGVALGIIWQIQDICSLALLDKFFKRNLEKDTEEKLKRVYYTQWSCDFSKTFQFKAP